LFQAETDKAIMERTIYQRCLDLGIISNRLFTELERLYKERNKVIHRFVITDIRSEDVFNLALEYEKLYEKIDTIILELERKQIEEGIGVWGKNPSDGLSEEQRTLLQTKIRDKHGRLPIKK
jgi:cobalamin biosynthesis Mg chelatase CobN